MTEKLFKIFYEEEVDEAEREVMAAKQEQTPKKKRIDMSVANRMLGHALISVGVSCKDKEQRGKWVEVGKKVLESNK
jgi:hypothetical protein